MGYFFDLSSIIIAVVIVISIRLPRRWAVASKGAVIHWLARDLLLAVMVVVCMWGLGME